MTEERDATNIQKKTFEVIPEEVYFSQREESVI